MIACMCLLCCTHFGLPLTLARNNKQKKNMLTLEVIPGQGVGAFYLGMPTSDAIQYLASKISQKHFKAVNKIDVVYDAKEPLNQDIVLNLMDDGLLFRFEPITQRLKMVEVHDLLRVRLKYGNTLFTSHADHSSFVKYGHY